MAEKQAPAENTPPVPPEDPRVLLAQAQAYQVFGLVFLFAGFLVFLIWYTNNIEGRLASALSNPAVVLMIIIPFLPALILTQKSRSLEKKARALIEKGKEEPPKK